MIDIIINSSWILAWGIALYFAILHGKTTYDDWQAVVISGITNGRKSIAFGNMRTMAGLILVSLLNLLVGIVATLTLFNILESSEYIRFTNVGLLFLAAFTVIGIIIGKRYDRGVWESTSSAHRK